MKSEVENENIQEFNRFLKNNSELLQDKYREYFTLDSVPITSIQSTTIVRFISDIFSFDRYHDLETTTKINKSLTSNYESFLKVNKKLKDFNINVAIDLLKYSIENNQLFAVKYETKEKEDHEDGTPNDKEPKSPKLIGSIHQNEFTEKSYHHVEESPRGSSHIRERSDLKNSFEFAENEFDFHEEIKVDFDPMVIKKNSKVIFDFYCKQQMSLAKNLSFERIERESTMLTMNNLLIMAQMMNFYSSSVTKQLLMGKFRKLSGGKQDISYDKFDTLLSELQIIDPTLVARSELNSPQLFLNLKTKNYPFNTQDLNPRQLVKKRAFRNKVTLHSGKMEADLLEELKEKKSNWKRVSEDLGSKYSHKEMSKVKKEPSFISKLSNHSHLKEKSHLNVESQEENDIITTKKLLENRRNNSSDLRLINKIVSAQDDDKWLGEYQLNLPQSPKHRHPSYQEQNIRKGVIIEDLKKRIRELERYDNRDPTYEETRAYIPAIESRKNRNKKYMSHLESSGKKKLGK